MRTRALSRRINRTHLQRSDANVAARPAHVPDLLHTPPNLLNKADLESLSHTIGNRALQRLLAQRSPDELNLTSAEFAGDPVLEDCLDGKHRMVIGEKGPAVEKVQKALMAAGIELPIHGADSKYGGETAAAVSQYKQARGIEPSDGVVGPKTIAALDKEIGGKVKPNPIPPPPPINPDLVIVNKADGVRLQALDKAIAAIENLQKIQPEVPNSEDRVVKAFGRQMLVNTDALDKNFWLVVERAKTAMQINKVTKAPFHVDRGGCTDFAHVDESGDPGKGITFCNAFFNANDICRREVVAHEFFHFVVGLQHHYDATTTEEALNCPHHLAELVFDIAMGEVGGCAKGGICVE